MTPLDAIAKFKGLRETLSRPAAFYAAFREEWETLAAGIALDILGALRPPEVDPGLWALACEAAARRVVAQLVAAGDAGVIISIAELPPGIDLSDPNYFNIRGISVKDVARWVEASRDGELEEDIAKRLDSRDAGKTDLQVAWRILYALKLNKPGAAGLEAAIVKFLGAEAKTEAEKLYPEVLKGWLDYFVPLAFNDFQKWVDTQVAAL